MHADYTPDERAYLLALARRAVEAAAYNVDLPQPSLDDLPPALRVERACFVTLRSPNDRLRGCTGTLVATRPLVEEVATIAGQTARSDPRFLPVEPDEVPALHIEISVLTPPQPLIFDEPADLLERLRPGIDGVNLRRASQGRPWIRALRLRPGIDGVILRRGVRRATFLPQVWESYPDPRVFLGLLCEKMGGDPSDWQQPDIQVDIYQVIVIEEPLEPSSA